LLLNLRRLVPVVAIGAWKSDRLTLFRDLFVEHGLELSGVLLLQFRGCSPRWNIERRASLVVLLFRNGKLRHAFAIHDGRLVHGWLFARCTVLERANARGC